MNKKYYDIPSFIFQEETCLTLSFYTDQFKLETEKLMFLENVYLCKGTDTIYELQSKNTSNTYHFCISHKSKEQNRKNYDSYSISSIYKVSNITDKVCFIQVRNYDMMQFKVRSKDTASLPIYMIEPEVGIKFSDNGNQVDYTTLQTQGVDLDLALAKTIQSQYLKDRMSPIYVCMALWSHDDYQYMSKIRESKRESSLATIERSLHQVYIHPFFMVKNYLPMTFTIKVGTLKHNIQSEQRLEPESQKSVFEYDFDEKLHFQMLNIEGFKDTHLYKLHDPKLCDTQETFHELIDTQGRKVNFNVKRVRVNTKCIIFCIQAQTIVINKSKLPI